jgi:hypothetical protein
MLLYVGVNIVLIVMPATLYVLRPVDWRRVVWGVVIHLLCFTIPTVLQVLIVGGSLFSTFWDTFFFLGLQLGSTAVSILGPVAGALTYRLSGYRLVSGRVLSIQPEPCGNPPSTL